MSTATQVSTLAELLERGARQWPHATAVEDSQGWSLTYRELHEAAGRLANCLTRAGVQPGDRVGICMPKSINSVICVMGALRARTAYVPVDYSAPPERNRYIFDNCQTRVICADEPRAASLTEDKPREILIFPGEATDTLGAPWLKRASPEFSPAAPVRS